MEGRDGTVRSDGERVGQGVVIWSCQDAENEDFSTGPSDDSSGPSWGGERVEFGDDEVIFTEIHDTQDANDDQEFDSFEAQLARLNLQTERRVQAKLLELEDALYEQGKSARPNSGVKHELYYRDGVPHTISTPASISEWKVAYPFLRIRGEGYNLSVPIQEGTEEVESVIEEDVCCPLFESRRAELKQHLVERLRSELCDN